MRGRFILSFHLLPMPTTTSLSHFMRRLLTGYALSCNRRHKRSGHLFQNRYKSIVCEEEPYLLELIRYIHLNPLRAETGTKTKKGRAATKENRGASLISLGTKTKERRAATKENWGVSLVFYGSVIRTGAETAS
jgi:hypothetical protein